jgi:hypothetical protein
MQVSRIINSNLEINSQSFKDLSPVMKEAVSDIFKLIEKEQGNVIKRFENAVNKIAEFHNINLEEIENYFDKEILEQLGEK